MSSFFKGALTAALFTANTALGQGQEQAPTNDHLYIYAWGGVFTDPVTSGSSNTRVYWLYKFDGFPQTMDADGEYDNLNLRGHISDPESGDCLPLYSYDGDMGQHYSNSRSYVPEILPLFKNANNEGRALQFGHVLDQISAELRADLDETIFDGRAVQPSDNRDLYVAERLFSPVGNDPNEIATDRSFEAGRFHGVPYAEVWLELQKAEANRKLDINTPDECTKFEKPEDAIVIG